ncbi:hypothetical protein D3C77_359140 [compost metagenome]
MGKHLVQPVLYSRYELLPLLALLALSHKLRQRFIDLRLVAGLQQIMLHAILHRAAGIFEILVTRQHDEPDVREQLQRLLDQFQPVQPRHGYIADDEVRLLLHDQLISLDSIACRADQLGARASPIHDLLNALQYHPLIIYEQHLIHPRHLLVYRVSVHEFPFEHSARLRCGFPTPSRRSA